MTEETAVEMFVGGLVLDPNSQAPVVVLKDESGSIHLPIWIGMAEATSIASAIKQLAMARPLTHDLMYSIFNESGIKLERVIITELRESTYYAELILSFGDKALIFDARPSDAIALAIRASAPIFVSQEVLNHARMAFSAKPEPPQLPEAEQKEEAEPAQQEADSGDPNFQDIDKEQWKDILSQLDPDDFKYKV